MLETSARLLRLLSLLQTRRDWPGDALAERLGVSPRTVRRDVDRLRELGYPVTATKGPDGGYRLAAGAQLPPLLFDEDQAVAVAVALQTATTVVGGIEESALRALNTIQQVMPARLRHRVEALQVTAVRRGSDRPMVDTAHLVTIGAAVRAREQLRFDYRRGDTVALRQVEPHHVVTWGHRWYLVAWDLDRADWRMFRVDRMTPLTPAGPRYVPRPLPTPDVASFVAARFAQPNWPCQGVFILHAPAQRVAELLGDKVLVEEIDPERSRVTAGSWSWLGLAAWSGFLGMDFDVVGPEDLRQAVADLARRYIASVA